MAKIRKSQSSGSCSGVSDLPSSIILEILVKLPIRSVIRCRCVCKYWNDLISETHFATRYFKNPPLTVLVKFKNRIVQDLPINQSYCFIEIGLNCDVTCTPFNPKAMNFRRTDKYVKTVGSCNGLLCFVQTQYRESINYFNFNNDAVYVINPLLGEVTMLPQVNQSEGVEFVFFGFGFSTQSDHYKVVRFLSMTVGDIHGEIFTIGVDHKWRSFEDSSIPFYLYPYPITLNGFLYFVADECLFAFDIEEERGHTIQPPSELSYELVDRKENIVLGVFNGNLCLSEKTIKNQIVIWTMKRNGVAESWSREIILKSWIPLDICSDRLIPVTTLRNGDLLMACHSFLFDNSKCLISYNPKTNERRKLEFSDGGRDCSYFYGYVPSFFPLSTALRKDTNI